MRLHEFKRTRVELVECIFENVCVEVGMLALAM